MGPLLHHQCVHQEGAASLVTSPVCARRGRCVPCYITSVCTERTMRPLLHHQCVQGEGAASLVTSQVCARKRQCVPCYITSVFKEWVLCPLLHHQCVHGEGNHVCLEKKWTPLNANRQTVVSNNCITHPTRTHASG
jgi:hypothetical protein